ncbi:DUF2243 domain-containing protein [Vreelandella sp. V005]|uniref:DUF2243 domain-containing protein n=1 Tax=Vreelandella sp. V005 TaxID=3459608 RepID=UPI004043BB6A
MKESVGQKKSQLTLLATILLGLGSMAAIDEIIFHQLLGWHHFVDVNSSALALASDGLLHTLELILLIGGGVLLLHLYEQKLYAKGYQSAGFLLGMGGFQLFDGIVTHKILGLHQVRYVDNLLLYDLGWNASGLLLLLIGFGLLRRAKRGLAASAS